MKFCLLLARPRAAKMPVLTGTVAGYLLPILIGSSRVSSLFFLRLESLRILRWCCSAKNQFPDINAPFVRRTSPIISRAHVKNNKTIPDVPNSSITTAPSGDSLRPRVFSTSLTFYCAHLRDDPDPLSPPKLITVSSSRAPLLGIVMPTNPQTGNPVSRCRVPLLKGRAYLARPVEIWTPANQTVSDGTLYKVANAAADLV